MKTKTIHPAVEVPDDPEFCNDSELTTQTCKHYLSSPGVFECGIFTEIRDISGIQFVRLKWIDDRILKCDQCKDHFNKETLSPNPLKDIKGLPDKSGHWFSGDKYKCKGCSEWLEVKKWGQGREQGSTILICPECGAKHSWIVTDWR